MFDRRVVVTGVGLVSPLGHSLDAATQALQSGRSGIGVTDAWASYGVRTRVGGFAGDFAVNGCTRKQLRSMGRVAKMAVAATAAAVEDAGLSDDAVRDPDTVLLYGSTDGSTNAAEDYYRKLYTTNSLNGVPSSSYLKIMSHTCAANLAQVFGITGRVVPICSACTSGSQAIGEGFVSVATGRERVAICGGAEEMHVTVAGVFDLMLATSTKYNDRPSATPRPFDRGRDGMVVGEGAGTVVLEDYEHARKRGARIYAEVVGYGTNCDGCHLTTPSPEGMAGAMKRALQTARVSADQIDYINAHATGTEVGDIAESKATLDALGDATPISSTKGHTGHTLGGCGAVESIFTIGMLTRGFVAPTLNLEHPDERCAPLRFVIGDAQDAQLVRVMNNNFAFGGINTSIVMAAV